MSFRRSSVILILTLVLGVVAVAAWLALVRPGHITVDVPVPPSNVVTSPVPALPSPRFNVDGLEGIQLAYPAALAVREREEEHDPHPVRIAVLPHHAVAAETMAAFWANIAAAEPSVVVLVGPAHENQGTALVQTTAGTWTSPLGDVRADERLVARLQERGVAAVEPGSFLTEHSIGVHVPFLTALLPGTPILPIIAQSPAGEGQARAVAQALADMLPPGAVLVASVDFAHDLPAEEADARDALTVAHVRARDYAAIARAGSDQLDAPFALILALMWQEREACDLSVRWRGNSSRLLGDPAQPGTSYFVYECRHLPPLTLKAAGDVMLARDVGARLARNPDIPAAFADARAALAGGDLIVANLESVLSAREAYCGSGICFKADPARVDALQAMGLTHAIVANNHAGDYGEAAWEDSRVILREAGIVPVGGFRNDGETVFTEAAGRTVAMLAFETVARPLQREDALRRIREARLSADLVVASFHWGTEYAHHPDPAVVSLARAAVDAGADLVLGHHPHVLQGVERYGDGLILYSLGNFTFDQPWDATRESMVATVGWHRGERTIALEPMRLEAWLPRRATEDERAATLERLASWSAPDLREALKTGMIGW